jgi:hypothetical protein
MVFHDGNCNPRLSIMASQGVVLGKGASRAGYTAATIADESRGVGLLRAEGKRIPRRVKAAYLTDSDIRRIVARAAALRSGGTLRTPVTPCRAASPYRAALVPAPPAGT